MAKVAGAGKQECGVGGVRLVVSIRHLSVHALLHKPIIVLPILQAGKLRLGKATQLGRAEVGYESVF